MIFSINDIRIVTKFKINKKIYFFKINLIKIKFSILVHIHISHFGNIFNFKNCALLRKRVEKLSLVYKISFSLDI